MSRSEIVGPGEQPVSQHEFPEIRIDISHLEPGVQQRFWPTFHDFLRERIRLDLHVSEGNPEPASSPDVSEQIGFHSRETVSLEEALAGSVVPAGEMRAYLQGEAPNLSEATWRAYGEFRRSSLSMLFFQIGQETAVEANAAYVEEGLRERGITDQRMLYHDLGRRAIGRLAQSGKYYPRYTMLSPQENPLMNLEIWGEFAADLAGSLEREEYPDDFPTTDAEPFTQN